MPRASTRAAANKKVEEALQAPLPEPGVVVVDGTDDVGLDDLFAPLEDTVDTYNMCFWGREGSGKTTALATAAARRPPSIPGLSRRSGRIPALPCLPIKLLDCNRHAVSCQ